MEVTHDKLIKVARDWLVKPWRNASNAGHGSCSVVITDMTSAAYETPDAIGWHSGSSTLVECKVSRSDFLADQKKHFRQCPEIGVGDYRYYMAPCGLLKVDELPSNWGLIEVNDNGKTRVVKVSEQFDSNCRQENTMLLSLLCRLKVDPGKHVKIRSYTIDDDSEPRATVTFQAELFDDPKPTTPDTDGIGGGE